MRITPEEYRNQRYGTRVRYSECRVYWFERGETLEVEHVTQDEKTQQWFVHLRGVPEPRPCSDSNLFVIPLNPTEIILSVLRMEEDADELRHDMQIVSDCIVGGHCGEDDVNLKTEEGMNLLMELQPIRDDALYAEFAEETAATYRRYLQTIANYFDDPKQVSAEDMTYRERTAAMYNQALGGLESGTAGAALLAELHAAKHWAALWKRAAKQQRMGRLDQEMSNGVLKGRLANLHEEPDPLYVNEGEAISTASTVEIARRMHVALQEIADDCPDTLPQIEDYTDADAPEDDLLIDRVKFRLGGIARRALGKDEANEA